MTHASRPVALALILGLVVLATPLWLPLFGTALTVQDALEPGDVGLVLEGTVPKVLRVAAGHIGGTALPGTAGNVGIAAHRDTFFRALRDVRDKDLILVTTPYGTFRYVVEATEIVNPTDVEVLRRTHHPELTLVTCYPFIYIGAAPKRFVVHAQQEG